MSEEDEDMAVEGVLPNKKKVDEVDKVEMIVRLLGARKHDVDTAI